jgi:hypothetical protein
MKNAMKALTGAVLVIGFAVSGPAQAVVRPAAAIDLSKPTAEEIARITRGEVPDGTTIKVPAGTALPVAVKIRGDVIGLADPEAKVALKARRDVWLRFEAQQLFASLDGVTYKPFTQVFTGSLTFALGADENGENLRGELGLELRTRMDD